MAVGWGVIAQPRPVNIFNWKLIWWVRDRGDEKENKTYSLSLFPTSFALVGMAMLGPCSLYWLREDSQCHGHNSNLIWKRCHEKNLEWWGKIKTRGKLTVIAFCKQVTNKDHGSGPLFPVLTEGGWPAGLTEEQFNWKKMLWEKVWNGGENIKGRGKLTLAASSMWLVSGGWQWWVFIPLVNWGRARGTMDGITTQLKMQWWE